MNPSLGFHSRLAKYFEDFISLRRASGAVYGDRSQPQLLRRFDRYLVEHWRGKARLRPAEIQAYFDSLGYLTPNSRRNPLDTAWRALSYALRHSAPIEDLPPRPEFRGAPRRIRDRYVFTWDEIARLRRACRRLRPRSSLRPLTFATLFGLLYVTGIRISEALGITISDVDFNGRQLLIRAGKFRKERLLPIRQSTARALRRYLQSPKRVCTAAGGPFFVSSGGRPIRYAAVHAAFRKALEISAVRDSQGRFPRIHDLRYTFAAHRLQDWYKEGRDVDLLLPALSTYLGHVDVEFTLMYLRPAAPLLRAAADRFEAASRSQVFREAQ